MTGIDWRQIAGFLTVLAICGSFFTWIVSHILYKSLSERFTAFEEKLQKTYVTKEMLNYLKEEADQTHSRYEKTFNDLWSVVNAIRSEKHQ